MDGQQGLYPAKQLRVDSIVNNICFPVYIKSSCSCLLFLRKSGETGFHECMYWLGEGCADVNLYFSGCHGIHRLLYYRHEAGNVLWWSAYYLGDYKGRHQNSLSVTTDKPQRMTNVGD